MVVRGGMQPQRGGGGSFRGGAPPRGNFRGGFRGGHSQHHHHHHHHGPGSRNSVFIPFQPFDIEHCETHFPRVEPANDSKLSELLLQRNKMLVPEPTKIAAFDELYNKITEELKQELTKTTEDGSEEQFEEMRKVGAYSNETLIAEVNAAEMLVQLKEAPELELMKKLGELLQSKLSDCEVTFDIETAEIVVSRDGTRMHCFVTCNGGKIRGVGETHVPKKSLYKNFDMRKRTLWFREYGQEPNVKVLARLIGDLRCRFEGLRGLTQWSTELLAHYCVTGVKFGEGGQIAPLPIAGAFRRLLMILSSGFFLPGSMGIRDPVERDGRSVHQNFPKKDMDNICAAAQTLLRVLMQGAPEKVIGLEAADVCEEMQIIDGVVIQPSMPCHVEDTDEEKAPEHDIKME